MKNFITTLFATTIVFLVIISASFSFVDDVFVKDTSIAQNDATQQKDQEPKAPNQEAGGQVRTAKSNSFTVGKVFGGEQGGLDATEAMVNRGKNYLLTQVDHRLKQLGPFRDRIKSMTALSDTERKNMVSELNAEIGMFETLKPEISQSATKQDIKNVAEKIKAEWLKSRRTVAYAGGKALAANQNQLISDAHSVSLGIQKRIESLKASGKGTKAHEKLLTAYVKKIAEAKQDVDSANEKFNVIASASTGDEKEKLIKEKDLLLKSSKENIKVAYKLLAEGAREDFSQKFK